MNWRVSEKKQRGTDGESEQEKVKQVNEEKEKRLHGREHDKSRNFSSILRL